MKILLSAYACEPNKGSEPSVGWNWLLNSAETNNEVWVVTRKNNQSVIEKYFRENIQSENTHFIYYDLPSKLMFIKKMFGIYLYYLFWQLGAFIAARRIHKKVSFDQVHHVTFATIRQPSFMGLLGIPFIYGPVGGGESPPYHLIKNFPWQPKRKELMRIFANLWVKFDPLMHFTFYTAKKIVVTSAQTKNLVAKFYRKKVDIKLAIAQTNVNLNEKKITKGRTQVKLLFIGRYEYWKGAHLCIKTLVELNKSKDCLPVSLTLIGEGPFKKSLQSLACKLGVDSQIDWQPWMKQSELEHHYSTHDVFVFPSLHDSGGMVVLESLAASLPVVCLDLGGPATIVDESSGVIVNSQLSESEVCKSIAKGVLTIIDSNNYVNYCKNAKIRANTFTWEDLVKGLL